MAVVAAGGILGVYLLFGWFIASNIHHRLDPAGTPMFYDFSAFYRAGALADAGHAAAAYDDSAMIAAEQAAFPGTTARLPWHYPPSFQMLLMPLAAMPYVTAWLAWSGLFYGGYALLAWRLVKPDQRYLLLLAPGAAGNLMVGQNGLLSTALLGGGVLLLARRPILGGALLGLLTFKPHFAVLVPLALICGREWRALAAAIASGAALMLLSVVVLGAGPWLAFLHKAVEPSALFSSSSSAWRTIPSVMMMARSLGLDPTTSAVCHWSVAAAAVLAVMWIWRRTSDAGLRAAGLATATLLVTPYLRPYDLALLILPLAVLLRTAGGKARLSEQLVVMAAWVIPMLPPLPAAPDFGIPSLQIDPVVSMAALGLIVRRVTQTSAPAATAFRPVETENGPGLLRGR